MAKFVRKWRIDGVIDHLDDLESIIHDLKDLLEVIDTEVLNAVGFNSKRKFAYWNIYMIRRLLGLKHK